MLNNKVIKSVIEDLKNITKIDLCVANFNGDICATTFNEQIPKQKIIHFLNGMMDSKTIDNYNFFKVTYDISSSYVVITKGDKKDYEIIGKICASELKNLIIAYREKTDKNTFIKNLILDNVSSEDIYIKSQKLNIQNDVNRVVIIVKTCDDKDKSSLEMIKHIFAENKCDFITSLDKKNTIIRFTTENEDIEFEIISAFYSRVYYKSEKNVFRYYYFVDAKNEEEYNEFVKNAKDASLYDTGKIAKYGDRLITLSTCSYHTEDGRFVVVAREKDKN